MLYTDYTGTLEYEQEEMTNINEILYNEALERIGELQVELSNLRFQNSLLQSNQDFWKEEADRQQKRLYQYLDRDYT